jgi:hypothetical protein
MSYEQKYLKYKQKYQELKKKMAGINNLEVDASTDVQDFLLTETPTFENQQTGGNIFNLDNSNNETEMYSLSDTPNDEHHDEHHDEHRDEHHDEHHDEKVGGSETLKDELSRANDELLGGNDENTATQSATQSVAQQVAQDELSSTTDIDKIQNTEDIENLFNQLGGKKRRSRRSSKHSDLEELENLDSSDESSVTTSSESLTDISSDDM